MKHLTATLKLKCKRKIAEAWRIQSALNVETLLNGYNQRHLRLGLCGCQFIKVRVMLISKSTDHFIPVFDIGEMKRGENA